MTAYPNVSRLAPDAAHAKILRYARGLAGCIATPFGAGSGPARRVTGLLRILERHAPAPLQHDGHRLTVCRHCTTPGRQVMAWPCPDYRDSASGMCDGLPPCRST